MLFHSLHFLVFFPLFLIPYFVMPGKVRAFWLLLSSLFFYMCWNPYYVVLLLLSILTTYGAAILMEEYGAKHPDDVSLKKSILLTNLILNLGILFLFKYFYFTASTVTNLLSRFGILVSPPKWNLLLPVGISFYIFQAVGYSLDVYRGKIKAERNLITYALFVSFFPQLVAGPIERADNLLPQLQQIDKIDLWKRDRLLKGAITMLYGYFLKLMIAERAAIYVDTIFDVGTYDLYRGGFVALAAVLFTLQIYCDFAGYTYIAIGAARMMGIGLMDNFRAPYLAEGIQDFWSRWHISLTTWFKDYLYIPLGGSRRGGLRKKINILIVFLVSGIWHGAGFGFIVWGLYHGVLRLLEEETGKISRQAVDFLHLDRTVFSYHLFRKIMTFIMVAIGWIFFRAKSLHQAVSLLIHMVTTWNPWIFFDDSLLQYLDWKEWMVLLISVMIMWLVDCCINRGTRLEEAFARQNLPFQWMVLLAGIAAIVVFGVYGLETSAGAFIYFQF